MTPAVRYAEAEIPTPFGSFRLVVYRFGAEEHLAVVKGDVRGEDVLARVHSECWTGETLGSLKCDCRAQLDHAMAAISRAGRGVIVYLRQEGRGIGLGNKIRAYALQAEGKDTVEANLALGFAADLRSYEQAAAILADLGVESVSLMTNNPDKLAGLEKAGVKVADHVPHWVQAHEHNEEYLEVKRAKLGHLETKR
jgi:GTP cyclohydrolase II